ncbi:MAG: metallophosphoesterase, partial [Variovorax sp.]
MPLRPLTLLTTLLHLYIGMRLLPALATLTPGWPVVLLLLAVSVVTMPLPFIGLRSASKPVADSWKWIGLLSMGWFSSMFVLTLVRDVALMLAWATAGLAGLAVDWPQVTAWSAAGVPLLATGTSLIGFVNARRTARVRRVDVPIAGLPAALQGFTIAQLSDIHVGPTIKGGYIHRIVEAVNKLGADVVA